MAFIDLPERSDAWHSHRLKFIGGSEVAALFGEEERPESDSEDVRAGFSDSLFSLHYIKSGKVKPRPVESDRIDAGIFLEPAIGSYVAAKRGWKIAKGRYAIDDITPGMGASLDYEVVDAGTDAGGVSAGGSVLRGSSGPLVGPGLMQIKNVDSIQFVRKWKDDEPPLYVILQVQHELACSGYKWGVLAAMVGGNTLKLYFYEPRPQIITLIRQKVAEFWQRINEGTPPNVDGSDASAYALRELFPVLIDTESAPVDLTGNNELPGLCSDLEKATAQRLALDKQEKSYKAQIAQILGKATYAMCGSWVIKCSVTPENKGRSPRPGEVIGARKEVRKYTVKENV